MKKHVWIIFLKSCQRFDRSFLLATSVCTYSGTFWKANPVRENGLFIVFSCIYRNLLSKFPKSSLTSILVPDFHRLPDLGGLCNRVFRVSRLSKNLYTNFHTNFPTKSQKFTKLLKNEWLSDLEMGYSWCLPENWPLRNHQNSFSDLSFQILFSWDENLSESFFEPEKHAEHG